MSIDTTSARESSRQSTGQFGEQNKSEPSTTALDGSALDGSAVAESGLSAEDQELLDVMYLEYDREMIGDSSTDNHFRHETVGDVGNAMYNAHDDFYFEQRRDREGVLTGDYRVGYSKDGIEHTRVFECDEAITTPGKGEDAVLDVARNLETQYQSIKAANSPGNIYDRLSSARAEVAEAERNDFIAEVREAAPEVGSIKAKVERYGDSSGGTYLEIQSIHDSDGNELDDQNIYDAVQDSGWDTLGEEALGEWEREHSGRWAESFEIKF